MRQPDVVVEITNVLRETEVDPRCIQLEITERSALTDLEVTCSHLTQLRALGVRVAIDDFGTGYSSLSYLKQLPIDVLKLDKSFVDGIDGTQADSAIVQAIITMGHALGIKVTAEGVERIEQVDRLRQLGCDTAMGWLWSKSVPPERVPALAAAGLEARVAAPENVLVPIATQPPRKCGSAARNPRRYLDHGGADSFGTSDVGGARGGLRRSDGEGGRSAARDQW